VHAFFEALFYDKTDDEYIEIRLRPAKKDGAVPFLVETVDKVVARCEAVGDTADVWFGVAPRHRAATVVKRSTTIWADIDAKSFGGNMDTALQKALYSTPLKPSCIVKSGFGYHAYWFLTESAGRNAISKALKAYKDATSGDNVVDVTRFMRVPGTYNLKYDPPRECVIEYLEPSLRYTLDDLLKSVKVPPPVLERIISGDSQGFDSRSERDWGIVVALLQEGVSNAGVKAIFETRACGDKYGAERNKDHYIKQTLKAALASVKKRAITIVETAEEKEVKGVLVKGDDNCYYATTKGNPKVSTFVLEPEKVVVGLNEGDVLVCTVKSGEHSWPNVSFPKGAFDRTYNLQKELTSVHWQWLGTDQHVRALLPILINEFNAAGGTVVKGVSAIGRVEDMWVTNKDVITVNGRMPSDVAPLQFIDRHRLLLDIALTSEVDQLAEVAEAFGRLYPAINKAGVAYPILGWFVAASIKPLFEQAGVRFPNLSIWGTKGSGKSTVIDLLYKLFGVNNPRAVNCRTTPFVMLSLLASTTSVPVHLGEFRADMPDSQFRAIRTWLLMSYDAGQDARGRPDQSVVEYPLTAPIVIDGEDLFDDPAVQERMIVVNLNPEVIGEGTEAWQAYMELAEYPLEQLAMTFIKYTLALDVHWADLAFRRMMEMLQKEFPVALPSRIRRNAAVCMVGWQLFADFMHTLDVEFPWPRAQDMADGLSDIVNLTTGRTTTQVDDLVVDIINHAAQGGAGFSWKYDRNMNILWVHLATTLPWWYKQRRMAGQPVLGTAAIKRQLRERLSTNYSGTGQYVMEIKSVNMRGTTMHAYGISVDAARAAELDVPSELNTTQVTVNITGGG
jgi:hypothetical protein